MAAVEEAIRTYLLSKPAVSSLVGTRIYPDVIDQSWNPADGPAVAYTLISSDDDHSLSDRVGHVHTRIQFTCYAATRSAANALARAMKNSGITGIKGVYSDVDIRGVRVESGIITDTEKPDDGLAPPRYLAEFDLMVDYIEE